MYRLLIADDERIERMALNKTLNQHIADICEIYQAENGREALALYEQKKIQVAILDIEMPGIDGIQAAEAIRAADPDCCIIFLTAYDEFNYAKKAITVKALDYLLKPYQEEELLTVLEAAFHQIDRNMQDRDTQDRDTQDPDKCQGGRQQWAPTSVGTGTAMAVDAGAPEGGPVRISMVAEIIGNYIKDHYREDISMQQVAQAMNYSEAYFSKLFKQCFAQNFTAYLTGYRIVEAKQLLRQPTVNVKRVGELVGYPDSNYFAKVFRRHTGYSPTEYRLDLFQKHGLGELG